MNMSLSALLGQPPKAVSLLGEETATKSETARVEEFKRRIQGSYNSYLLTLSFKHVMKGSIEEQHRVLKKLLIRALENLYSDKNGMKTHRHKAGNISSIEVLASFELYADKKNLHLHAILQLDSPLTKKQDLEKLKEMCRHINMIMTGNAVYSKASTDVKPIDNGTQDRAIKYVLKETLFMEKYLKIKPLFFKQHY